jgi:hypothetical protein
MADGKWRMNKFEFTLLFVFARHSKSVSSFQMPIRPLILDTNHKNLCVYIQNIYR